MAKEGSVAPKERINIKYVPATGDQQEEVELPLKLMVMGDFKGRSDDTPIEEREPININKNNFQSVLRDSDLSKTISVKDRLNDDAGEDDTLTVNLNFSAMRDFSPDAISDNVAELRDLKKIREALVALKTPLGNVQAFRKSLQELVSDKGLCEEVLSQLQSDPEPSVAVEEDPK